MKILDRYILRTLLVPLGYCFMAFVLLYVIYDLFDNLPDFIDAHTPILLVVKFYVLLLPSVMIYIMPISLILSVLYSLLQLTKNNEITAMRASGISIFRIVWPCIGIGFTVSLLVTAVNETAGPWCAHWSNQFLVSENHKDDIDVHVIKNLPYRNVPGHRIWLVERFNTQTLDMDKVAVIQQREDGSEAYQIQSESAQWLDGRWWFVNLTIQQYDREGNPKGPPRFERGMEAPDFDETPKVFLNETKTDTLQLSAREIYEYIQSHLHLDEAILTRYRVDFHNRLAMPWMCFVVTLIGIPFGTYTGRKGALLGIVLCLILFFSYYSMVNVGLAFGKKQMITPWVAAWTPNLVFLVLGTFIVARMR